MASRVRRVAALLRRYRVDRRLPPQVLRVYVDVGRLRVSDSARRFGARVRPPIRTGASARTGGPMVLQAGRRVESAGPLDCSLDELAHRNARAVTDALHAAAVDVFAVARRRDMIVLGVELHDRGAALSALEERLVGPGWLLDWEDGGRSGTVGLRSASRHRHVRRARTWRIYRVAAWGDQAIGRELAAEVGFWEIGTSGQFELIGTRGHERFDPRSQATVEVVDGREYPGRSAFPIGADLARMTEPVDIVYTWVDGSDPAWQAAFRATAADHGRRVDEVALDPARYRSRDELRYSLRSVWAFCGWARRIFVVTAGQVPSWLVEDERVVVVDHSEILPADALPTFNSHSLESALHHIDGLAEHFVYFNDDMLVGRSLRPEDFFTANGLARVFQGGARMPAVEDEATLAVDTAARRGRELLLERFGRAVADKPYHSPYPLRRSVMEEIETEFPEAVKRTSHSRFRAPGDLSIAASFAQHYGIAIGKAVFSDIVTDYVNVESGRLGWHLERLARSRCFDTFCVNETEVRADGQEARERVIRSFFDSYFPVAAPWETGFGADSAVAS
jgi:hypothetical protein